MTTVNISYSVTLGGGRDVSEAETTPTEVAALMPPSRRLELTGDVGAQIAAMLIEAGGEAKQAAQRSRETAIETELAAFDRQIEAMQEKATEQLIGGIASGVMTGASGVCGIASATGGSAPSARLQGAGKICEAGAGMTKATFDFIASASEREASVEARAVKQAERQIDIADDDRKAAQELIDKALDAYKEYVSSRDAASRAAILKA